MKTKGSILAIEESFPPELASSHLVLEFWREVSNRGYTVTVVTCFPKKYMLPDQNSFKPPNKLFYWEQVGKIKVLRIWPQFKSQSIIGRALEYILLPLMLLLGGLKVGKREIIHCQSPPLLLGVTASIISKLTNTPFILRVQDIHPDALVKIGLIKNRILINILESLEKFIYQRSCHITVIAEGYKRHILSTGISWNKISLIPNWAEIKQFDSLSNVNNFRKNQGLNNKYIVTYAGTMSWPQDLETVIEAANIIRHNKEVIFLIVGEGIKKELLIKRATGLKLDNVIFMPLQPRAIYFDILRASDACLVPLMKSYTSPTSPSKMSEIMACAKPIIANVPYDSDVYNIIKRAKCGIWVESENPEAMIQAILKLKDDTEFSEVLGKNGKDFAEKNLTLKSVVDEYEGLFMQVQGRKNGKSEVK